MDYYKKCVFESSVECSNNLEHAAFVVAWELLISSNEIKDKCQEISQCDPNPCKNNAECIEPKDGEFGYTCKCLPGYSGPHCDIGLLRNYTML